MSWQSPYSSGDSFDLDDPGSPQLKWGVGVAVAVFLIGYGIYCLVTGNGIYPDFSQSKWSWSQSQPIALHGRGAIAMGIVCLSLGSFLNGWFFWGSLYDGWPLRIALACLLIVFTGSIGYLLFHLFVFGPQWQ